MEQSSPETQGANRANATRRARKLSAFELVEHTIARVEALDAHINAVVVRDFDRA